MSNCVTLSKGRKIACKSGSAGIKAVSFVPFDSSIDFTSVDGEVTVFPGTISAAYRYQTVNDGSNYTETLSSDKQTRSVLFTSALNLILAKIDTATRNEILLLTKGAVWAFVENYNGEVFLCGSDEGMDLTGGTIATGGARTDLSGYTLNFVGMENEPMKKLATAAKLSFDAIVVDGL